MTERFTGNFTQQEPIPDAAIDAAMEVLRSGRLHRYNTAEGEAGETALLEQEFAAAMGARYALATASGGSAIATALRALQTWVAAGQIKVFEDVVEGLENAPQALIGLLAGENKGKRMVRVGPDP